MSSTTNQVAAQDLLHRLDSRVAGSAAMHHCQPIPNPWPSSMARGWTGAIRSSQPLDAAVPRSGALAMERSREVRSLLRQSGG